MLRACDEFLKLREKEIFANQFVAEKVPTADTEIF